MDWGHRMRDRYPELESAESKVQEAYDILRDAFRSHKKLLVCGNGGSAADAEHIVGELMKGFHKQRPLGEEERRLYGEVGGYLQGALPAIALTGSIALTTAFQNDVHPKMAFAQQVYGYGNSGDVLLAISTSGNSENILYAADTARSKHMKVIGLTGRDGGKLKEKCDCCIIVPGMSTAEIQEYHLPVYHTICAMLEETFFRR